MQLALAIGTCVRAASPVLLMACALLPGAGSRSCERSGSTATASSTSPPRPAGATSTPRSRVSGRRHARELGRMRGGRPGWRAHLRMVGWYPWALKRLMTK